MNLLPTTAMLSDLCCSACREPALTYRDTDEPHAVVCGKCGRRFPCDGHMVDFLLQDRLDKTNLEELKGNDYDLSNPAVSEHIFNKQEWSSIYGHSLLYAVSIVERLMAPYGPDATLYCLGSGTGFEIKALSPRRRFRRIYASDISKTALSIAHRVLDPIDADIGMFVAEFAHIPVRKKDGDLGLVFQALHHTADIHQALDGLLQHNFTDLIIVEPTTNWLVEILARLGLAKRKEYSGLRPSWMNLRKIERIAAQRGYATRVYTWWEFPHGLARWFEWNRRVARMTCHAIDAISHLTAYFRLGSMSAIRFTRQA